MKHQPVWKSKQYSLGMKLSLYNSIVKPVLLYGAECWRVVKSDMKINAFHNGCLRRICCIFWPNKISNEELYKKIKSQIAVLPSSAAGFDGLGMSSESVRNVSPRLPWDHFKPLALVCRDTLVHRERSSGVPREIIQFHLICPKNII